MTASKQSQDGTSRPYLEAVIRNLQTVVQTSECECLLVPTEICLSVMLVRLTVCTMKCGVQVVLSLEFVVEAS